MSSLMVRISATAMAMRACESGEEYMDSMTCIWNLNDGTEVESDPVFFWHMDDMMNGIALSIVASDIEWKDVTSYLITVVKDVKVTRVEGSGVN